jgi:hypothetical protein
MSDDSTSCRFSGNPRGRGDRYVARSCDSRVWSGNDFDQIIQASLRTAAAAGADVGIWQGWRLVAVCFPKGGWLRLRQMPADAPLHLREAYRQLVNGRYDEADQAVDQVSEGPDAPEVVKLLRMAIDLRRQGCDVVDGLLARIRRAVDLD